MIGTDGIWESRNPAGEFYGKDRLRDLTRELDKHQPGDTVTIKAVRYDNPEVIISALSGEQQQISPFGGRSSWSATSKFQFVTLTVTLGDLD